MLFRSKSYDANGQTIREDKIRYAGLGSGAQPEVTSVSSLVTPLKLQNNGVWLKEIDFARTTFGSNAYKTSVRYVFIFDEADVVANDNATSYISECGLFTDGLQNAPYTKGARQNSIGSALSQTPVAYHSFEPIPKNNNIQLEIIWELRH